MLRQRRGGGRVPLRGRRLVDLHRHLRLRLDLRLDLDRALAAAAAAPELERLGEGRLGGVKLLDEHGAQHAPLLRVAPLDLLPLCLPLLELRLPLLVRLVRVRVRVKVEG